MSLLAQRLLAVHAALDDAALPHAFGGAIALAYCTEEPRGTRDLDINVFVPVERSDEVLDALPREVDVRPADRSMLRRDGQVRVMWDDTPLDLFLAVHEFHMQVALETRIVPFEDASIPVLACDALIVFKAMFNRTRDWADIEAMLAAGAPRVRLALERLEALTGAGDAVVARLRGLVE